MEPLRAAASALTLNDCIMNLIKLANACKNAPENLKRYQLVLTNIQQVRFQLPYWNDSKCLTQTAQSTKFIESLFDQSDSIRAINFSINGKSENLVEFYKKNVAVIVEDVQKLLNRFEQYSSQGMKGFLQKLKIFLKQANTVWDLVVDAQAINDMITAAKHVESSQFFALQTALLVHNQYK